MPIPDMASFWLHAAGPRREPRVIGSAAKAHSAPIVNMAAIVASERDGRCREVSHVSGPAGRTARALPPAAAARLLAPQRCEVCGASSPRARRVAAECGGGRGGAAGRAGRRGDERQWPPPCPR